MRPTEILIERDPEAVFEVLSNPGNYGHWVVGSRDIRNPDPNWPEPGSRFQHTVGAGPIKVSDETRVEDADRPRRLVLRVKFRPIGCAQVRLDLDEQRGGTRVSMRERPLGGPVAKLYGYLLAALFKARNKESLRRLKFIAERA